MRKPIRRSRALRGVVLLLALAGAGVGLSFATTARALEPAAAQDTTTTTTTPEPSPDPAPAPAPSKPKPVSKPAPKPVHHTSTPVYRPPVRTTTARTYTPTYSPPPVTHTTPRVTHHAKKHRRHVVAKPKPAPQPQVQPTTTIPHINVGSPTAAVAAPANGQAIRRLLVIAGIGFAALLFLVVVTVPATGARFTTPGRVVIDHQTDLLLAGVATLLLTALLFAVTGGG